MTNKLYYGDNLDVLRQHIRDESVDLVYLDPPFNSNANYNVLFRSPSGEKSQAQIEAFADTWHWNMHAAQAFDEVLTGPNAEAASMLRAIHSFLGENDMMAYLAMMAVRLLELHRVLKPTGSLYLHCDPTASHYLKILLDAIFQPVNFANEIIWQRSTGKSLMKRRLPNNHDVILFVQKGLQSTWNETAAFTPYDQTALLDRTREKYSHKDSDGRLYQMDNLINPNPNRPNLTYDFLGVTRVWRWTKERMQEAYDAGLVIQSKPGMVPRFKRYLDEQRGLPFGDVWTDIPPLNSQAQERLGYPTQKPVALMERIISVSTNPGDVVLDPFCGCGTSVHAAQKLNRQWLGIDITHLAISLIERRLKDAFPGIAFTVEGTPKDLAGARDLALRDKYQFQWWATSLIAAVPAGGKKKGADRGVDGYLNFRDADNKPIFAVVSVKGGDKVSSPMIRDLKGVVEREKASIGVFITLAPATRDMVTEAAAAGFYETGGKKFPKIQILTIEDLFDGRNVQIPFGFAEGFKKPAKEKVELQKSFF
jgi:site-specific DNA-methyltransferase (adenine-specific)